MAPDGKQTGHHSPGSLAVGLAESLAAGSAEPLLKL